MHYLRVMLTSLVAILLLHGNFSFDLSPYPINRQNYIVDRQVVLKKIALIPFIWSQGITLAEAKVNPNDAFAGLVKARVELETASNTFLPKKNYKGMREYFLTSSNMEKYEENANVLLASKQLDAESKKDIGTIRRYGVGADVIIMYGGLKSEIGEENEAPDYSAVKKALKLTMNSLDEVIAICRSNGF